MRAWLGLGAGAAAACALVAVLLVGALVANASMDTIRVREEGPSSFPTNPPVASVDDVTLRDPRSVRRCRPLKAEQIILPGRSDLTAKLVRCRSRQPARGVIVYVTGGPGIHAPPYLDGEDIALVRLGYDVLYPNYFNLGDVNYPVALADVDKALIDRAVADVAAGLRWAHLKSDHVVLAGDSAGPILAALACHGRCADAFLAFSPVIQTPRALGENWPYPFSASTSIQYGVHYDEARREYIAIEEPVGHTADIAEATEQFTFQFGTYSDAKFLDIFSSKPNMPSMLVLVGQNDARVGYAELSRTSHLPSHVQVLGLCGGDHEGLAANAALQLFVREWLDKSRRMDRLSGEQALVVRGGVTRDATIERMTLADFEPRRFASLCAEDRHQR